ncbi:MAG: hypothetical protein WCB68_18090 [Pyrinomonadaceae bacterium]
MALYDICAYKDVAAHIEDLPELAGGGIYTGHHIIPDHCFYYTSGLRGKGELSAFLCPGVSNYTTANGLVIIVTADSNGGKSREHGRIHDVFDPIEFAFKGNNRWTYAEARDAAIQSVMVVCAALTAAILEQTLDAYYKTTCRMTDATLLRAGEHGAMKGVSARTSARNRAARPY